MNGFGLFVRAAIRVVSPSLPAAVTSTDVNKAG